MEHMEKPDGIYRKPISLVIKTREKGWSITRGPAWFEFNTGAHLWTWLRADENEVVSLALPAEYLT